MRLIVPLLIASNFRRFLCSEVSTSTTNGTVKEEISNWTKIFKKQNIPGPEFSSEQIMAHVLGFKRMSEVYKCEDQHLTQEQKEKFDKCCECRLARMPIQYIIREWDFRNLNLFITPPVFIPRPETEELIDVIANCFDKNEPHVFLEVGFGTGAISLSLLQIFKKAQGYAIDKSYMACLVAANNARTLLESRIELIYAELTENGTIIGANNTNPLQNMTFDYIVSNPPYIPTSRIKELEPEVKLYEDLRALDGGPDGMNVIKSLMIYSCNNLVKNGSLFMEIDEDQGDLIKKWIKLNYNEYKLKLVKIHKDFNEKDRHVHIMKE